MKIIMISLDSLRANRLGCYGYPKPTSPYLDKIARDGVLFENAFAADIPTESAHTAIFTGKTGIKNGIVSHGSHLTNLPKSTAWLPTILRSSGLTTAAVDNLYQLKEWFARGYRYYINSVGDERWIDGKTVNGYAKDWLTDHKDEDFFLFLHYWDPHTPYLPPKENIELFYDQNNDPYDPGNQSMEAAYNHLAYPFFKQHHFDLIGPVTDTEYVNALYDAEVRYLDQRLQELDEHLEHLGIKEETFLIIFGDHGESLTEHDIYWDHCGLYDTTVQVPLIMRWPGYIPEEQRIKGMVQQVDLFPTIMDALNIDHDRTIDGKGLWPSIRGEENGTTDTVYLSECAWQAARGIRTEKYKFIKNYDSGLFTRPPKELYDIENDPLETNNLADAQADLAGEFEETLDQWIQDMLAGEKDPMITQLEVEGLPFKKRIERILHTVGLTWNDWRKNPSKEKIDTLMKTKKANK
ncbi:sulfatase [Gracilibacillus salinarum]|uniref:Sulfatase-like hydrolase/transferase n=1 Tax=Gracilibacillus salinarum TaxID=2932255 RepID=A0ABY4GRN6_9BACI|nr:sulfatase [Gracilibacillus salinarum]UOQ86929.1 sulfatase-like hydrolase/transferase [Gracilibacillus salinarum]